METQVACNLCGEDSFELLAERDRCGKPLATVICTQCGLVRHQTVPTEAELIEFYTSHYRREAHGERVPGPRRVMRAWLNGERICDQVAPLLPRHGKILEVGAGIGCTVKVFEEAGFQAEGIDPDGKFLNYSRDHFQTRVRTCSLYDLDAQQQYDAVLLVHVIEHLRSPAAALTRIARVLKPGGMLYVECPNLSAPFARRSRLFHKAHIFNFSPTTLHQLAEACGFKLRKRFGDDQDTNLQILFQHTGACRLKTDPENCRRTVEGLAASDSWKYHFRRRYLSDRLQKLTGYVREHLTARAFVADLLDQFHTHQQPSVPLPVMTHSRAA